jgi:hypothetical protein
MVMPDFLTETWKALLDEKNRATLIGILVAIGIPIIGWLWVFIKHSFLLNRQ